MKPPHIVPLSTQAVILLRTLHTLAGHRALMFPGDRDYDKPMSNNTILKALERMGYKGRMTGHGFRGIASTVLHEHGWNTPTSNCNSRTKSVMTRVRRIQPCAVPQAAWKGDAIVVGLSRSVRSECFSDRVTEEKRIAL